MVVDVSMRSLAVGSLYDYMYGSDLGCDVVISQGSKIKGSYFWTVQDEYCWFMNDCSSTLTSLLTSILRV
jgi:hypothetical protein